MTPADDRPLHELPITVLGARLRSGALSPVALTEHFLQRLAALNGPLNAYKLVASERALAEARAAETLLRAGCDLGPLHGIPYATKDIYDVAGLPTTAGSKMLEGNLATENAAATERLARAGMILLGKTITVEFAYGGVGINHSQGTPHNPWAREPHVPGGSSAGSAVAVAAGLAPMTLGSDTGGSVRIPASLCGTVGLKTTVGRISRHGVFPLSRTLDSVGPLARTVEDAALVFDALQGEDPRDGSTRGVPPLDVLSGLAAGVKGLRLAFAETRFFDDLHPEVEAAVREAGRVFEGLGAPVASIAFPEVADAEAMGGMVSGAEACTVHAERLAAHFDQFDPVVALRMVENRDVRATTYIAALREIERLRASQQETLRDVDVLVVPTTMEPARPVEAVDASHESYMAHARLYRRNCAVGNLLNLCGVSLPCGFTAEGLPIGLLLYAKPFEEHLALRAAYAYEQATEWHRRTPELSWAA